MAAIQLWAVAIFVAFYIAWLIFDRSVGGLLVGALAAFVVAATTWYLRRRSGVGD